MRDHSEHLPNSRTWREIPQPVRPRAMSREGRKRFVLSGLKTISLIVAAGAVGWGVIAIAGIWQAEPKRIAHAVGTAPVNRIELKTDGMLDQAWVERTLALPRNITLMELDLTNLQQRLLANGQVRSVVLTKTPAATLTVEINERMPVARLRAEINLHGQTDINPTITVRAERSLTLPEANGSPMNGERTIRDFLVARDGVIFAGIGYDDAMLASLPWLAGVGTLARAGDGFAPIKGMETVSDLLASAINEAPQLYQTWEIVNLARLESDGEIEVRSSEVEKIIFSTSLAFFDQIARLDYVRDAAHRSPLKSVNLGLGSQVVVDYDPTAALERPAPIGRRLPSPRIGLPAFPNLQNHNRTNRDL